MQKFILFILILANMSSSLHCMQNLISRMRCTRLAAVQSQSATAHCLMLTSSLLKLQKRFATSHLHGTKETLEHMQAKAKDIKQAALLKVLDSNSKNPYHHYFARIKSKDNDYVHFCEVENRADVLTVIEQVKQGSFPCGYHSNVTYENGLVKDLYFGSFSKQKCPSVPPHSAIPGQITWHYGQNYVDFSKVKFKVRPA